MSVSFLIGRLARRAGTALVARASFHTKPVLKKFSASHAQGQSRTTTAAFGAAQRRAFTVASYWSSVGRNSYDALIKSKGRNWLGLLLGGACLGVELYCAFSYRFVCSASFVKLRASHT